MDQTDMATMHALHVAEHNKKIEAKIKDSKKRLKHYISNGKINLEEGIRAIILFKISCAEGEKITIEDILRTNRMYQ